MSLTKRRPTFLRFLICLVIGLGLAFGFLLFANPYYEGFLGKPMLRSGYFTVAAIAGLVIALFLLFPTRKPMRLFKWIGRLLTMFVVVVLIFVVGAILEVQNDMMFYPGISDLQGEAKLQSEPMVEEVSIKSGNTTYHGYMYRREAIKSPLLIYFGGNAEIAASYMSSLVTYSKDQYLAKNYHHLVVDYPGYAKSGGTPNEASLKDMAKSTMEYALSREDVDHDKIVLMGWSLGTGSAAYLASEYDAAGLILLAPFYNGTTLVNGFIHDQMDIPDRFYTNLPTLLVSNKFPSDEYAKKADEPTLIIAASKDRMINHEQAERLSHEFKNVQYHLVEGAHSSVTYETEPLQIIENFLTGIVNPGASQAPAPQ
ncbi:MAG: alpha/beta fold hydrolase [Bacillota bacterium]|nr:alpha/beta fold hydrolase [Bacillota bacterium]